MKYIFGSTIPFVIIVLGLSHFIWWQVAENHLDKTVAALRAQGEPITATDLQQILIPDGNNASLDYDRAANLIDDSTKAWKAFDSGRAHSFALPLTGDERVTVHAIVTQNAEAIAKVEDARGKIVGAWNDPPISRLTLLTLMNIKFNASRTLCNLLHLAAMDAQAGGDDQLAIDRLVDSLMIVDAAEQRVGLIGHLVALGESSLAVESIDWIAPELHVGKHGVTCDKVVALIRQLQNENAIDSGRQFSWRCERIIDLQSLQGMIDGAFVTTNSAPGSVSSIKARFFGYLIKPIVLGDERNLCIHFQDILQATSASDWLTCEHEMPTQLLAKVDAHPVYYLLLKMILPSYEKAAKCDYRAKAERRLAVAALAVRLYAADHDDHLPTSLDDLVPAYLPAISIDPMSGQPLKFKSNPPRIYSVGDDGIDDGGIPVDPDSSDSFHRHHGDLVVYLTTQPRKPISAE